MIAILEERFSKYENPRNIAERALSAMEEAGMLPPFVDQSAYGIALKEDVYFDMNYHGARYTGTCKWEEE